MFFDPSKVEDAEFETPPKGRYRLVVTDSQIKTTKTGTGRYVAIIMQIVGGKFDRTKIFANFNIENPNEQAVKIGNSQLKKFLAAAGVTEALKSEDDLHFKVINKFVYADLEQTQFNGKTKAEPVKFYSVSEAAQKAPQSSNTVDYAPDQPIDGVKIPF